MVWICILANASSHRARHSVQIVRQRYLDGLCLQRPIKAQALERLTAAVCAGCEAAAAVAVPRHVQLRHHLQGTVRHVRCWVMPMR